MTFLNPNLLWAGLACIALPVIVHLLTRRRRKPIEWGAMRFLLEAYRKHKRRLTLEQFLLLAARCLLVALVALAIGKPILGALAGMTGPGPRTVVIAIDDSLTSGLQDAEGKTALSKSVSDARDLLDTLDQGRGDRAALVTLGGPTQRIVMPPSGDIAGVKRLIDALEPTDSRADVPGAAADLRSEMFESERGDLGSNITIALFGEWRAGSADVERKLPVLAPSRTGSERPLILLTPPASADVDNVAVTGIEPVRSVLLAGTDGEVSSESGQIRVSLKRTGPVVGRAAESLVSVTVDLPDRATKGIEATQGTARWSAGQREATVVVPARVPAFESGIRPVVTASIDRDALPADNIFRRPIELRRLLQIGIVHSASGLSAAFGPGDWLRLALKPDSESGLSRGIGSLRVLEIDPRNVGSVGQLTGIDALFIVSPQRLDRAAWERCAEFCSSGGLVFVCAASDAGAQLWTDDFVQTFGLSWSIGREPTVYQTPATVADPVAAPRQADPNLLSLLSGEIAELVRPVRVMRALPVTDRRDATPNLLSLSNGTPLLIAARPGRESPQASTQANGRGLVVFLSTALDSTWTDLPTKPLMLPLIQEITKQGIGAARSVWLGIAGQAVTIPVGAVELRPFALQIPPVQVVGAARSVSVRRADVFAASDNRGTTLDIVAVNPDTSAGQTQPHSREDLSAWFAALAGEDRVSWMQRDGAEIGASNTRGTASLKPDDGPPPISPTLLLAALAVALAEMAMARWFSHATITPDRTPVAGLRGGGA